MGLIRRGLYFATLVLFLTGCPQTPENRIVGTWTDSIDASMKVVFDEDNVTFFGDSGSYTTERRSDLDFSGRDDGKITLNLSSETFVASYVFSNEDKTLALYSKSDERVYYLTKEGSGFAVGIPSGWTLETDGIHRYSKFSNLFFTTNKVIGWMDKRFYNPNDSSTSYYNAPYILDGGQWSALDIAGLDIGSFWDGKTEIIGLVAKDTVVAMVTNEGKTYLSVNEGASFTKVGDTLPNLDYAGMSFAPVESIKLAFHGSTLFAAVQGTGVVNTNNETINPLLVYRIDDVFSGSPSNWEKLYQLNSPNWAEVQIAADTSGILVKYTNLIFSSDGGVSWSLAAGGDAPENIEWNFELGMLGGSLVGVSLSELYTFDAANLSWTAAGWSHGNEKKEVTGNRIYWVADGVAHFSDDFGATSQTVSGVDAFQNPTFKYGTIRDNGTSIYWAGETLFKAAR